MSIITDIDFVLCLRVTDSYDILSAGMKRSKAGSVAPCMSSVEGNRMSVWLNYREVRTEV